MQNSSKAKAGARIARQYRVRRRVRGTAEKPRLCVFRSLKYTYVQLIDDDQNCVLASATTREVKAGKSSGNRESAKLLGAKVAELAKGKGISQVVFDRNGFVYHGRVAAVADGAREAGLKF